MINLRVGIVIRNRKRDIKIEKADSTVYPLVFYNDDIL